MGRSAEFYTWAANAGNSMVGNILSAFQPHAEFKQAAFEIGHPEDVGSTSIADGLPLNDQYGAIHRLKNEDSEGMWHHEENETPEEEYKEDK
jgi:hypothetical protein